MSAFFAIIPPVAYWVIVVLWTVILIVLVRKLRAAPRRHQAVVLLVVVLTLDAFRTLLESVYFGVYWSAVYGVFPDSWRAMLQNPVFVAIPKLVTVGVGFLVLFLLLRRWFPADEIAREAAQRSLSDSREQMMRAEMRYHRILETSLDVICTFDHDGRFVDVSLRSFAMWGYKPEEMVGRTFLDFVHPDDRAASEEEAAAICAGELSESIENRYIHKDGHTVYMVWSTVWSADDQLFYTIARDVTRRRLLEIKRRELEERLNQSQRLEAVGQLTGGVAHDFNNLLTVIIGNAKLLRDKLEANDELRRIAATTQVAAERGAELTQRLLAFSRRQSLEPRSLDVNRQVEEAEILLRRLLGEHIEINLKLEAQAWRIYADPLQLEAALINLGVNGRDAMPAGGRLTISTQRRAVAPNAPLISCDGEVAPGDYMAIAVADQGSGMAPEVAARVFEPFFTTKELGKGSGLGLSMVYGFVRQSGGYVLLESAPGRGTTVTLLFPRDERADAGAPLAKPEAESAPKALPAAAEKEKILVAEDNDLVRTFTGELLRKLGYEVIETESGAEALAALAAHPDVALLFSDMMMPGGMTGGELARQARALRPGLHILLTSGYVENNPPAGTIEGIRILRKPYLGEELARALRETMAQ